MADRFFNNVNTGVETHFSAGISGELEFSQMYAAPRRLTTFNGGEIVPIYCREVLPNQGQSQSVEFIIRPTTMKAPVFDDLFVDIYAFFVPNRIVNQSWASVMGENVYGTWSADSISLAPLMRSTSFSAGNSTTPLPENVSINVGSVADHYGFPTQQPIPVSVLQECNDLKFRGYIEIYNEYFRDQNYQPPVPYSKLNVYEGFLEYGTQGTYLPLAGVSSSLSPSAVWTPFSVPDNSVGAPSVQHAVLGNLSPGDSLGGTGFSIKNNSVFNANGAPLVANKLHDYYTSVLPSPLKAPEQILSPVTLSRNDGSVSQFLDVFPGQDSFDDAIPGLQNYSQMKIKLASGSDNGFLESSSTASPYGLHMRRSATPGTSGSAIFTNYKADLSKLTAAVGIEDLRMSVAIQHVYEQLARTGSRYREYVRGFFGIEVDNPFLDVPKRLGHIRRKLDVYQTAQTAPGNENQTPASTLTAFGYTNNGGFLFKDVFYEHGYIHVFAVVRHRNIYSSELARDNFRLNMLDFYQPQLANITEQPVRTVQINPFVARDSYNPDPTFGFQEAFAEYRYENDTVSGYMRTGISNSLSVWNYADTFDPGLISADGDWLKSNTREVLDRSLAVSSEVAPQFKALFVFPIEKSLPMPTYSVGGLDTL